jgi:hypothetical protein
MGCMFAKVDVLHVNDDEQDPNYGIGFSKTMFKPKEWNLLKTFCNKKGVFQTDLNHLFNIYLTNEEVYLRQFRVKVTETKKKFTEHSLLNFEISDVYIPQLFMRPFHGLEKPAEFDEVTFPRFVVLGYTFCTQPMTDMIYEYFSIMRQNYNLQLPATMFSFNVLETVKVLSEEMDQQTSGLLYVYQKINPANDTEYTLEDVIRFGIRYPVMFYPLQRFRLHFRRLIFGDKFWANKKPTKTKFPKEFGAFKGKSPGYENEAAANVETARSIIADYQLDLQLELINARAVIEKRQTLIAAAQAMGEVHNDDHEDTREELKTEGDVQGKKNAYANLRLPPTKPTVPMRTKESSPVEFVTAEILARMKADIGYKLARDVVRDSKLPYAEGQAFMDYPEELDENERIYDNKVHREFMYNVGTGTSAWVQPFVSEADDEIVRETWTKISQPDEGLRGDM